MTRLVPSNVLPTTATASGCCGARSAASLPSVSASVNPPIAPEATFGADAEPSSDRPLTAQTARTLVENHRAFLGFLERRTGDRELAQDLLQEAFLRGFEKLSALRDDEAAIAWFYRMLRNAVVDVRRRRAASERALDAFETELAGLTEPARETRDAVCACVSRLAATLKPEYREALQQVEIEGASVKDYAAAAGISASNAGVRVFRAREALRRQVVRSCGTCATHGCVDCTCAPPSASGAASPAQG